jgi:hypothetical protein
MRSYEFAAEARRNPEQNPKISVNQAIQNQLDNTEDKVGASSTYPEGGLKNLFVSFTQIEKLGINPGSTYKTPLGIYAYPAEYVVDSSSGGKSMHASLPFAGEHPWVNIFKSRGNIVNLSSMNQPEAEKYYKVITSNVISSEFLGELIRRSYDEANFPDSAGGEFWYVTLKIAEHIARRKSIPVSRAWNRLFRTIGIDGCVDEGVGIIHESEPTQAVFFSSSAVELVERVANKYSPGDVQKKREQGRAKHVAMKYGAPVVRKLIAAGDIPSLAAAVDDAIASGNTTYLEFLNKQIPTEIMNKILEAKPGIGYHLSNPTREQLLYAALHDPRNVEKLLSKPTGGYKKMQLLTGNDYEAIFKNIADKGMLIPDDILLLFIANTRSIITPATLVAMVRIDPRVFAYIWNNVDQKLWPAGLDKLAVAVADQKGDDVALNRFKYLGIYK